MSNPDAEGAINSINEFTQYIAEHKPVAEAFRTDINKNKEDIAGLTTRMGEAETDIGTKAAQADLNTLADRVTAIETEHDAETTGLKARLTQAEADIDALEAKVGDKDVNTQITEITDPLAERIVELEKVDHSHANAAELDKIADGDKAKWDAKLEDVTAAADSGLKATKTGNTVAIEIDDSVIWVFDCGDSGVTAAE
jgi:chromosome segregation ATPase